MPTAESAANRVSAAEPTWPMKARVAGLIAVAALPVVSGISASAYRDPAELASGFHTAMWITAAMCAGGGLVALLTIRRPAPAAQPPPTYHCALDATPLRSASALPDASIPSSG